MKRPNTIWTAPPGDDLLAPPLADRFRDLILERTGMWMGPRRHDAMARAVLAESEGNARGKLEAYYRLLQKAKTDSALWERLIAHLAIGETSFFRDPAQIRALRRVILPGLIALHRQDRRLRIWSAGCASGEEPYTIAMLLHEMLPDIDRWRVFVLGTDISKASLQKASAGRFSPWSFRQTDPAVRARYFKKKGNAFELNAHIRERIAFAYLNLSENCYPSLTTNTNAMDLILFRNVAIYQPESIVKEVAGRFHNCLMPGGFLMVGAAETGIPVFGQFTARNIAGITVFQKVPSLPAAAGRPVIPAGAPRPMPDRTEPLPGTGIEKDGPVESPVSRQEAPTDLYAQGVDLMRQKRFKAAGDLFEACTILDPASAQARLRLGRAYANMGRLEKARACCTQAIAQDPLVAEAHYTLALIHQEEGQFDQAIDGLRKALFLDKDFVLGHFNLAILYRQKGLKDKTALHRRHAVRMASRLPPDRVLPGSDDLSAAQMLTMARAMG